jgi:TatD DNase family protein
VWFTAGVHPHEAPSFVAARDLPALRDFARQGAVAVGECGLDYHYGAAHRDAQLVAFRAQIELAAELGRPLVVHTREAEDDTRALVDEATALGACGVLHCYTARRLAERALDAGWYVSFSGVVTFRRWRTTPLLRLDPDDRLLVESDAPYLAPVPHRGAGMSPRGARTPVAKLATCEGHDPRRARRARRREHAYVLRPRQRPGSGPRPVSCGRAHPTILTHWPWLTPHFAPFTPTELPPRSAPTRRPSSRTGCCTPRGRSHSIRVNAGRRG